MMTEQGVFLAEFLQKMMKPEWEEFSSYIFNIYNILQNPDQWEPDIYVNALRSVYATRNSSPVRSSAWRPLSKNHRADGARGKPGKSDRECPRIL
ncbi:MAG: Wadjet anti-phage system protein JetA family protein [Clostridium fessum]